MFPIVAAIISIAFSVVSFFMSRKAQKNSLTAGDLDVTSADEGDSIPVIFGTCDVSPNVTAFLAGTPQAIKK